MHVQCIPTSCHYRGEGAPGESPLKPVQRYGNVVGYVQMALFGSGWENGKRVNLKNKINRYGEQGCDEDL
jgi:hypothetical protein